jgi:hypothetical protein
MNKPVLLLRGFETTFTLMSGAAARVARVLVLGRLIPQNDELQIIGPFFELFILLGLLVFMVFQPKLKKSIKISLAVAFLGLMIMFVMQLSFVKTIDLPQGASGETKSFRYLIGWSLAGEVQKAKADDPYTKNMTIERYIENKGPKYIPLMFGQTFWQMACLYSISYLVFTLGVVFALGGIMTVTSARLIEPPMAETSSSVNTDKQEATSVHSDLPTLE